MPGGGGAQKRRFASYLRIAGDTRASVKESSFNPMIALLTAASTLGYVLTGVSPARTSAAASTISMAAGDSCLIIQNKGGGHGEIGYHLALQLVKEKEMVRAPAKRQ